MINRVIGVAMALGAFVIGPLADGQEAGPDRLNTLRAQFEELKADANSAQAKFDERYVGELKKLAAKAKEAANLDLVLAIRDEEAGFRTRPLASVQPSPHAGLVRLQEIYDGQKKQISAERQKKMATLVAGYRKQLTDLMGELTKAGDIDSAVAVRAELIRVEEEVPTVEEAPDPLSPSEILTSRKWLRHTLEHKVVFQFHEDGELAAEDFETTWNRWKIEGDRIHIINAKGRIYDFGLSDARPFTLTCRSKGNTHIRYVEIR